MMPVMRVGLLSLAVLLPVKTAGVIEIKRYQYRFQLDKDVTKLQNMQTYKGFRCFVVKCLSRLPISSELRFGLHVGIIVVHIPGTTGHCTDSARLSPPCSSSRQSCAAVSELAGAC